MSHTDRDRDRWFWKNHDCPDVYGWRCRCAVTYRDRMWTNPFAPQWVPASWRSEQRRCERAHARNLMDRARYGCHEWESIPIGAGRVYRHPWHW